MNRFLKVTLSSFTGAAFLFVVTLCPTDVQIEDVMAKVESVTEWYYADGHSTYDVKYSYDGKEYTKTVQEDVYEDVKPYVKCEVPATLYSYGSLLRTHYKLYPEFLGVSNKYVKAIPILVEAGALILAITTALIALTDTKRKD